MNNFKINVSYFQGNPFVSYSRSLNHCQNKEVKGRVLSIVDDIFSKIPAEEKAKVQQIHLNFSPDKKVSIIYNKGENKEEVNIDALNGEVKSKLEVLIVLIGLVSNIGLNRIPTSVYTHTRFVTKQPEIVKQKPSGYFNKLLNFIIRLYVLYYAVGPSVNKQIKILTKEMTPEQLRNLYTQPHDLFATIRNMLAAKYPDSHQFFEHEELEEFVSEMLIQSANHRLSQLKSPLWQESDIYQMDVLRMVNHLKFSYDPQVFKNLSKVSTLEMPLKELSAIPVTPQNKEQLVLLWKNLIGDLFSKGRLDKFAVTKTKDVIKQNNYAQRYLQAIHLIPQGLREDLKDFCKELNDFHSTKSIQDLLIQRSLLAKMEIITDDPQLIENQEIYRQKIKPHIEELITTLTSEPDEDKPGQTVPIDIFKLAAFLSRRSHSEVWDFLGKIELTDQEKGIFTKEALYQLLFNELERVIVLKYNISSLQLSALSEERKAAEMKEKHTPLIQQKLKEYVDERELIKGLERTLRRKKEMFLEAKIRIPEIVCPLEILSEVTKERLVTAHFENKLQKLEQEIQAKEERLTTLRNELKGVRRAARHQKLARIREEQSAIDDLKKVKEEEVEAFFTAKSSGDSEALAPFYETMGTITLSAHEVSIKDIDEEELERLASFKKIQEEILKPIDDKIKAKTASRRERETAEPLHQKVDQIDKVLRSVALSKQALKDIPSLEQEIQRRNDANKEGLVNGYKNLLQEYSSAEALASIKPIASEWEPMQTFWNLLLNDLFVKSKILEIDHAAPVTDAIRYQIRAYINAKHLFMPKVPLYSGLEKIKEDMNQWEEPILSLDLKRLLEEAPLMDSSPLSEVLYGDSIIERTKSAYDYSSPFKPEYQAAFMLLTRSFNRLENKLPLSKEDQEKIVLFLNQIREDKHFKALIIAYFANQVDNGLVSQYPSFIQRMIKKYILKNINEKKLFKPTFPNGTSQETIDFIKGYLDKEKNVKEIPVVKQINEKLKTVLEKYEAKLKDDTIILDPKERLTLKEMGIVSRSQRLNDGDLPLAEKLTALGVEEIDPTIKEWLTTYRESENLVNKMQTHLQPDINGHYSKSYLLAHDIGLKQAWMGREAGAEERMTAFIGNGLTHAAKLYHNENNEVCVSNIMGSYVQEKMDVYELCVSRVWELDVSTLVDPSMYPVMEQVYGEDWKKKITSNFKKIENELHRVAEKRYDNIKNDDARRFEAGYANHPWVFSFATGKKVKGHERKHERDFGKIHRKFYSPELSGTQICSEFATKSTIAALVELNHQLSVDIEKADIGKKLTGIALLNSLKEKVQLPADVTEYLNGVRHYKEEVHKTKFAEKKLRKILKEQSYSSLEIQLAIRLGNKEIFNLPYSKKERLRAVHPGRMVQLLIDKNCVQLKEPPALLDQFIDRSLPKKA